MGRWSKKGWIKSFAWLPTKVGDKKYVWLKPVLKYMKVNEGQHYGFPSITTIYRSNPEKLPLIEPQGNLFEYWSDYDEHYPHQLEFEPLQHAIHVAALDWLESKYEVNKDFTLINEPGIHPLIWAFRDSKVAVSFKMRFMI